MEDQNKPGDAMDIDLDEGPWISCCPAFVGMGFMTCVMAIVGVAFGSIIYELDVQTSWLKCYSSTKGSSSTMIVLTPDPAGLLNCLPEGTGSGADVSTITETRCTAAISSTSSPPSHKSCWLKLLEFPGRMWINMLKLLIIPLMSTMMLTLPSKLKAIAPVGFRLLGLLLFTSFMAAVQGLIWVNIFKPGDGVECASCGTKTAGGGYISEFESLLNVVALFFPNNIVAAMSSLKIIGIIVFFLLFGFQITAGPKQWSQPMLDLSNGILRATLRLLVIVMWFTPLAMFSMVGYYIANTTDLWDSFEALGKYMGCQLFGQFVHLFGFYFGFYFLTTGRNPLTYFLKIKAAPLTALATSSSAATMPVTMRVNKEAGNDKRLVAFTIPLGAGMNMDGTSLGFPIMVMFTAQLAGKDLSFATQLTVAILAMVCSLGTAPIPNAGLVFLQMLFIAADLTTDEQAAGMGMIIMLDWLVDRVETAQNVTSDSFVCGILNHYFQGGSGPLTCCMAGLVTEENLEKASSGGVQATGDDGL